jgi:glutaredoxin
MDELKAYWAPGCTSCLRMKEFLIQHGVEFTSISVHNNPDAIKELEQIGIRRVPVVTRGRDWADGQLLNDVARVAGIQLNAQIMLSTAELAKRVDVFLSKASRLLPQIPEDKLELRLPDARSFRQLGGHIYRIIEIFLQVAQTGERAEVTEYSRCPANVDTTQQLIDFGADIRRRFADWSDSARGTTDFTVRANVYFDANMHEFFERSTWHAGQHTRQLQAVVENLGFTPACFITDDDIAGLPMPDHIFDDKVDLNEMSLQHVK